MQTLSELVAMIAWQWRAGMVATYVSITQLKDDALQTSVKSQILTDDKMILKIFDSGMYISSFNKINQNFFC